MKALLSLKSAKNQSRIVGTMALVTLLPVFYPHLAFAADTQTSGSNPAQIFEIKVTDPSLLESTPKQNSTQNSLTFDEITQTDPLVVALHDYLLNHNSPLADYTVQLLSHGNWKTIIAISFVESNMCQYNLNYNCSGIGGPGHFYAFKDFGGWIDCMSDLLNSHYSGWSLDKMNGVYVQPKSANWAYGSKKIYAELTVLENAANEQRIAAAQAQTQQLAQNLALNTFPSNSQN